MCVCICASECEEYVCECGVCMCASECGVCVCVCVCLYVVCVSVCCVGVYRLKTQQCTCRAVSKA